MRHETKALGTGCATPDLESCPWLPQLFAMGREASFFVFPPSEAIQQPASLVAVFPGALCISA